MYVYIVIERERERQTERQTERQGERERARESMINVSFEYQHQPHGSGDDEDAEDD